MLQLKTWEQHRKIRKTPERLGNPKGTLLCQLCRELTSPHMVFFCKFYTKSSPSYFIVPGLKIDIYIYIQYCNLIWSSSFVEPAYSDANYNIWIFDIHVIFSENLFIKGKTRPSWLQRFQCRHWNLRYPKMLRENHDDVYGQPMIMDFEGESYTCNCCSART